MKLLCAICTTLLSLVAPLAGAWIETPRQTLDVPNNKVAPLAGAWIETPLVAGSTPPLLVAPLAGAWIETVWISIALL